MSTGQINLIDADGNHAGTTNELDAAKAAVEEGTYTHAVDNVTGEVVAGTDPNAEPPAETEASKS
jgi:hypothetical protein